MSLNQLIKFYKKGWDAKQLEAKVHWSAYGQMMSGDEKESTEKPKSCPCIEEIRRYPGYENAYYNEKGKLIKR